MHPKKIVQSKLRRRLAKAVSELGQHYLLIHLATKHISLQILLIYYILSFQKLSIILNKKVVPNDNFKFGCERVKETIIYRTLLIDMME